MSKVGFGDLVALAKSGWTPEQVNNTLDRLEKINQDDEEKSQEDNNNESQEDESGPGNNDDKPDASQASNEESEDSSKDARIKELEEQLAAAQKANRGQNHDQDEKKTLDDMVDDIFKEYFD